ncbi:SRPBCC family protein [Antrihabitans cavernicola]|uniref:SRPBCC family protein n=1 Tax=Antrihabitans cavernicola TaxID=2495913 RepID=A0A5A7S697_9NOCA|nr:SRPBCC family protein [Spelaeibacter cavernicola]KAA0021416.1 SRPBCC family protein [Spelaeibacter cavernicola]
MTPIPTGRLRATATGFDLEIPRTFHADIDDVWASVTESDRTAQWFGAWEGESGAGKSIRVQMRFEEGAPWMDMRVDVCAAPRHLALSTSGESGGWKLELELEQSGETTTLVLIQHRSDREGLGEIGPGWEYYLDNLVASRDGAPLPSFDDYYPAQQGYYEALR